MRIVLLFILALTPVITMLASDQGIIKTEFIVDSPPTAVSHASTIVDSHETLMAAWAGGSQARSPDTVIWLSRFESGAWSQPIEVANGIHAADRAQYACWNPVLFRPKDGPLLLFYKEGHSPETWWALVQSSQDNGRTWTKAHRLPKGIYGPIRNKPVELENGWLLCGASVESEGWVSHMEMGKFPFDYWETSKPLNSAMEIGAIQPTILDFQAAGLEVLCRTKQGRIAQSWSQDGGKTWGRMTLTDLPNPNLAIDALILRDRRALLVFNNSDQSRSTIDLAVSTDGKAWQHAGVLESLSEGDLSYPAVIQSRDGLVHICYSWKKERIRHVILDPAKIVLGERISTPR